MKVTNTQKGPRGINTLTGPVLVDPGQAVDVEVSGAELEVAKATGWFDISGEAVKEQETATGYAVTEKSPGWFVITKDGEAVTKSLRKDDVEGFDAMSDEDKAALVDLHKAD